MNIYQNNDVKITTERVDESELKVNVNGANLIYISKDDESEFATELRSLLDRYRI